MLAAIVACFDGLRLTGHQSAMSLLQCATSNEQRLLLSAVMLRLLAWQAQQLHVGSDCCPLTGVQRCLDHQVSDKERLFLELTLCGCWNVKRVWA